MKFFILFALLIGLAKCNIILKPSKQSSNQAGFIMVQGASIPAINYKQFALELQTKFDGSLWVVLTEFPFDLPEPVVVDNVMSSAFSTLKSSGFSFDSNTPFFFCGHSLGGIIAQNYVLNNSNFPFKFKGLILEGSFITRSNLNKVSLSFPSILTLGGELDGLARITRLTESYYHNILSPRSNNSYTIVVKGMNHYQFSGEGNPPPNVVKNDIKPEIVNTEARDQITSIINSFINIQIEKAAKIDFDLISHYLELTSELVQPIIDAFNLEGFYHFNPPCSAEKTPNCTQGSLWTKRAQVIMASIDESKLSILDSLGSVVSIPEHFPSMTNCTKPATCSLNISTYTQNVYSTFDSFDTGLQPVAAEECRTKMQSRQSVLQAYTNKKFDFNQTDAINTCAQINQEAINWALKSAPLNTVKRYLDHGKMLIPGDDIGPINNGFLWINKALSFVEKVDSKNRTYVELGSPTLRTPTDFNIKFVAGFHYCKLLSPARAIEWIYTDSVKP